MYVQKDVVIYIQINVKMTLKSFFYFSFKPEHNHFSFVFFLVVAQILHKNNEWRRIYSQIVFVRY